MKLAKILPLCIAGLFSFSQAVLDLPNAQPKVDASYWKPALDSAWKGLIRRNIEPYNAGKGLIHRPKSETPGDAVSEAVGYGMLVALYANDQQTFNTIWDAANGKMWNGSTHNWYMNPSGNIAGTGAATDAEEDIALALIFADKLVSAGKWESFTSKVLNKTYAEQAQNLLNKMWSTSQFYSDGLIDPGEGWGKRRFINPGYFSPAWYKVFANFDKSNSSRWTTAVDKNYEVIQKSVGYSMGMVPDWMTPEGGYVNEGLGYNAYFDSHAFFKDAIRILWRLAIDAIWFDDNRAKAFLNNALTFIKEKGGAKASNFYQIANAGALLPADDKWMEFNGEKDLTTWRYRSEHSHLTIGMWATAAMAVGESADRIDFSEEMAKFYEGGDYFGNAVDPTGGIEDTLHNEMYFDQFLAWFGTSMMSGTFVNVIDAIDNPKAATPGDSSSLTKPKPQNPDYILPVKREGIQFVQTGNTVLFTLPSSATWNVYDIKGNKMISTVGSSLLWQNASKGIYMVVAQSGQKRILQKISIR